MAAATGTAIAREFPAVFVPPLRVSFSWTLAGNLIYALCQFGMLSALAKLGNASIVGQYALALAIAAPVFMLTNLQLRAVQATDARHEYRFADYFTLRIVATLLGILVIVGIAGITRYDLPTKTLIVLVACAKAVETISDVIAGHLQKMERLDKVARALMLRQGRCGGRALRGAAKARAWDRTQDRRRCQAGGGGSGNRRDLQT